MSTSSVWITFWDPEKIVACQQPSFSMMIRMLPIWIQCALLHPRFSGSSILRWLRFLLIPVTFYSALSLSVDYCYLPLTRRGMLNLSIGIWSSHLAAKSLEWGIIGGFSAGRHGTVPKSTLKTASAPSASVSAKGNDWGEVARWTTELFFS